MSYFTSVSHFCIEKFYFTHMNSLLHQAVLNTSLPTEKYDLSHIKHARIGGPMYAVSLL